ncbi:MAG: hypothetical protein US76_03655 [Parcubacteria group bacterium GW2011_GWA2_38_13b]|nr:MAG: hypothetical protein US76_03655 [Parcubacteria group bacterium GW2011_GWA2_38_13b]
MDFLKQLINCCENQVYLGHGETFISSQPILNAANLEKFGINANNFDIKNVATLNYIVISRKVSFMSIQMSDGHSKPIEITDVEII